MRRPHASMPLLAAALTAAGAFAVVHVLRARTAGPESASNDGMVFGTPQATVFHEDYSGPAVVGDHVTRVPSLAPLAAGTRTHNVRMDIVAAEIEVAPGVRYQAWTFGGSVPGPVVHVREGDSVVFTMKNSSDSQVKVTEPAADSTTFLAEGRNVPALPVFVL